MFNPTLIVIDAFINELRLMYERTYTTLEPSYPGIISFAAQLALETIATSDATLFGKAVVLALLRHEDVLPLACRGGISLDIY
jgi:hypothetical protein